MRSETREHKCILENGEVLQTSNSLHKQFLAVMCKYNIYYYREMIKLNYFMGTIITSTK